MQYRCSASLAFAATSQWRLPAIAALLCLLLATPAVSQDNQWEIGGYYGHQFWGSSDITYSVGSSFRPGKMRIPASSNWGGSLGYRVRSDALFEIVYLQQNSRLEFEDGVTGFAENLFDMAVHYIQAGGSYEVDTGGNMRPFGGVLIGATVFDPKESNISSEWRLSFGIGAGVKVYLSERVGIRGQGHLLFPVQWGSGGMFCGTGGCNVGVGASTTIAQGEVSGGLFLAF